MGLQPTGPTLFVIKSCIPMLLGPGVQASGAATGGLATLGPATSAAGSPHSPHDWIYEDGLVKERAAGRVREIFCWMVFWTGFLLGLHFC